MTAELVDADLLDMIERVLDRHGPSEHDPGTRVAFDPGLWQQLDGLGLTRLTGDEAHGGSGASWPEAAALLRAAASRAVSLPLAEHDLLAGWLLERAGLPVDARLRTVAVLDAAGAARAVPWADDAERIVIAWMSADHWRVADVDAEDVTVTPGRNLLGEPRDDLRVDRLEALGVQVDEDVIEELTLRGGLARAVQVTGALERILELTAEHIGTRTQFGRPLARFQAIQHEVADIAAEVSLARACIDAAVHMADGDIARLRFLVPVARSCAGHAATVAVRASHQLHGAIGTTLEHQLHRYTLAALSWRAEFGSTQEWDHRVADLAGAAGPQGLWKLVCG